MPYFQTSNRNGAIPGGEDNKKWGTDGVRYQTLRIDRQLRLGCWKPVETCPNLGDEIKTKVYTVIHGSVKVVLSYMLVLKGEVRKRSWIT